MLERPAVTAEKSHVYRLLQLPEVAAGLLFHSARLCPNTVGIEAVLLFTRPEWW